MANSLKRLSGVTVALLSALSFLEAQTSSPAAAASPGAALPSAPVSGTSAKATDNPPMLLVQAPGTAASPAVAPAKTTTSTTSTTATGTEQDTVVESGGVGVREF